jgi:hypothetical protein
MVILPMLFGAFQPPRPHRAAHYGFFPAAENHQIRLWGFVVEKLRAASEHKHRRGPSTPRHKRCVTRSIGEGAPLRMTILWRTNGTETFVREPGRTADPSAALGMTKGRAVTFVRSVDRDGQRTAGPSTSLQSHGKPGQAG